MELRKLEITGRLQLGTHEEAMQLAVVLVLVVRLHETESLTLTLGLIYLE